MDWNICHYFFRSFLHNIFYCEMRQICKIKLLFFEITLYSPNFVLKSLILSDFHSIAIIGVSGPSFCIKGSWTMSCYIFSENHETSFLISIFGVIIFYRNGFFFCKKHWKLQQKKTAPERSGLWRCFRKTVKNTMTMLVISKVRLCQECSGQLGWRQVANLPLMAFPSFQQWQVLSVLTNKKVSRLYFSAFYF